MKDVIIGIVSKYYQVDMTQDGDENPCIFNFYRIMSEVNDALIKEGVITLAILPNETYQNFDNEDEQKEYLFTDKNKEAINKIINICDGIVLPGDVASNPYEEYIAKYCYDKNIPTLGICAGLNNMVRALGGSTKKITNLNVHDRPDLKYAHECKIINKNSIIFKCIGDETFNVNSIHTYVADIVPDCFEISALDMDNNPEVIEARSKRFYLGVKFHPELLKNDIKISRIFKEFINECEKTKI